MEDKIKTIFTIKCPHCKKNSFCELLYTQPFIGDTFSEEEVNEAKKEAIEKMSLLDISNSIKVKYIDWINSSETVFSKNEIDLIIETAKKDDQQ